MGRSWLGQRQRDRLPETRKHRSSGERKGLPGPRKREGQQKCLGLDEKGPLFLKPTIRAKGRGKALATETQALQFKPRQLDEGGLDELLEWTEILANLGRSVPLNDLVYDLFMFVCRTIHKCLTCKIL